MWNALITIPLQIVCQLVVQDNNNGTGNTPFVVDTQLLEASDTVLPNYVLRTPESSNGLPKGYTAFPDIGVAYRYYTDEKTWNSARKFCMEGGGSLAVLDTFQKIKVALQLKNDNKYGLFVGIHRLFDNSEWTSLKTGLQLSMIPWASTSNDETLEFRCMVMYFDGRGLTADDCTTEYRFICEIPLPVN